MEPLTKQKGGKWAREGWWFGGWQQKLDLKGLEQISRVKHLLPKLPNPKALITSVGITSVPPKVISDGFPTKAGIL